MTQIPPQNESAPTRFQVVKPTSVGLGHAQNRHQYTDQRIIQKFDDAIVNSPSIDQLLASVAKIVTRESECLGFWACQRNDHGEFGSAHQLTENDNGALWTVVEDQTHEMIQRVSESRQICSSPILSETKTELVVGPICNELSADQTAQVQLVVVGCFSAEHQTVLRLQWLVGLVSQAIARWHQHRCLQHQETRLQSLNATIGLVHSLDQTTCISESSLVLTNHLRRLCQSEQVAISFCDSPGNAKLTAISDVEQIDLSCESNRIVENANQQAVIVGSELIYPPAETDNSPALLSLEKYCKANGIESCINLPLVTEDDRIIGSVLIGGPAEKTRDENYRQYVGQIIKMASGHLDVIVRANRGTRDVIRTSWIKYRRASLTKTLLLGLFCLAGLMLVPLPYRVGCDCEVQPVMRRFIAAPHQGILEKSLVQSGDVIAADHLLAQLDGRQLRLELSGLRAEFDGARKRRDSALAQGDVATSQIARSEMQRHRAKMDILEQNLTNLEIRSPIAGIVVSGDLEKVDGAPVEMGQTLFEIAPLDQMHAEIRIPESEILYVEPGMHVAIKLNAFPFKTWTGTVEQISPRTEIIDDESVFIAQVKLANENNQLRPGMQGSAKIQTPSAPIGWNLFHKSWESVRYWLIW